MGIYPNQIKQYTDSESQILDEEKKHIKKKYPKYGLALSGGGIRSAAFSLGVMQALDKAKIFKLFDYLSTVSGGGYIGSSLTWWLLQYYSSRNQNGTDCDYFPFRIGTEDGEEILDYLRSNADYLRPRRGLNFLSIIAVVMRAAIVSIMVYLAFATLIVLGIVFILENVPSFLSWVINSTNWINSSVDWLCTWFNDNWYFTPSGLLQVGVFLGFSVSLFALLASKQIAQIYKPILLILPFLFVPFEETAGWLSKLLGNGGDFEHKLSEQLIFIDLYFWFLFIFASVAYSMATLYFQYRQAKSSAYENKWSEIRYKTRVEMQEAFGRILHISVIILLMALIAGLNVSFYGQLVSPKSPNYILWVFLPSLTLVLFCIFAITVWHIYNNTVTTEKQINQHIPMLCAALFIFAFFWGALVLATSTNHYIENQIIQKLNIENGLSIFKAVFKSGYLLILVFLAFGVGLFVNINYLGIHRMYRDRLMELFLPDKERIKERKWGLSIQAESTTIDFIRKSPHKRPYHIVNTNVVLVDSTNGKYKTRGGDNFIFSALYCGSKATGWCRSKGYLKDKDPGFTLATVMAISGALANPNAGEKSVTRNRLVSFVMTILGLRLGHWAPHPDPRIASSVLPPNYLYPGISSGLIFGNLTENSPIIDLTDGGHFENLGLYELFRRKLKYIVVCDGSADSNFNFSGLAVALNRAQIDFGVRISFSDSKFDLKQLLPRSDHSENINFGQSLAVKGFAIADIFYKDVGLTGKLVYIKPTLIPNLPAEICSYKARHLKFPHESTSDQFFNEEQFEAYRKLGYELGSRAAPVI